MGLHYSVVYICSAATPLPTYPSVILLFTSPGEREKTCLKSVYMCGHTQSCLVHARMFVFLCLFCQGRWLSLQMPPTMSHDPLLWGPDDGEVKNRGKKRVKEKKETDVWILLLFLMPVIINSTIFDDLSILISPLADARRVELGLLIQSVSSSKDPYLQVNS